MIGDNMYTWAHRHGITTQALLELMDMLDPTRMTAAGETTNTTEQAVQASVRLKASASGVTLWRNNSGVLQDKTGVPVRFGLANDSARVNETFKSSDLIGIWPRLIEQSDVGKVVGQFTAIECKRPGWKGPKTKREEAQGRFLGHVRASGGLAMFAQSVRDVFDD